MKNEIMDLVNMFLQDYTLEELFEVLDLDPAEAIEKLFCAGMIDEDDLAIAFDISEDDYDEDYELE